MAPATSRTVPSLPSKNIQMAWCFVRSNANHPWPKNTASGCTRARRPAVSIGTRSCIPFETSKSKTLPDCESLFRWHGLGRAASVAGHPHHAQALSTLLAVHNKTVTGCVGGHGLSELYAVLTRAPCPPPIYPLQAWKIISANVLRNFEIITLTPGMYRDTKESCANHGWIGGRIYDALRLSCARQAACDRVYTCNLRHFRQLAPDLAGRIGAPSGFL